MPPRQRVKLTPEQKQLSERLAEIRTMPVYFYRRKLIKKVAEDYGVCERTVYRWMEKNTTRKRKNLLRRQERSDVGNLRIPESAIIEALAFFETRQHTSAREAHAYLVKHHEEALSYLNSKGEKKTVSVASIRKIQKSYLRLWATRLGEDDLS